MRSLAANRGSPQVMGRLLLASLVALPVMRGSVSRAQPPAPVPAPAQAPVADDFICTSAAERREVRILPGCRVQYIKQGTTSTLWTSHDPAYCAAKAAGLVTTLVKANFSCKTETTPSAEPMATP